MVNHQHHFSLGSKQRTQNKEKKKILEFGSMNDMKIFEKKSIFVLN